MDSLKEQMESIQKLAFHFFAIPETGITTAQPKQLRALARKVEVKLNNRDNVRPKGINLEVIAHKAVLRANKKRAEYTRKELKYLPLALGFVPDDTYIVKSVIRDLDLEEQSFRVFRRAVYAYFNLYSTSGSQNMVIQLRQAILHILQDKKEWRNRISYLDYEHHGTRFLEKDGVQEMGDCFAHGIEAYITQIAFPITLRGGGFLRQAIISFFNIHRWDIRISTDAMMQEFQNIKKIELYHNVIPEIAETLIKRAGRVDGNQYIPGLIKDLNKFMGDPRDPVRRPKWSHVSEEAVHMYLSWRKKNDLSVFFNLVGMVIDNADSRRRWKYREAFWVNFIDDMVETRVILNDSAISLSRTDPNLKDKLVGYGRLVDGGKSKCLLMFSIGDYVFIEASDIGKLRIYRKGDAPVPFYESVGSRNAYRYRDIIDGVRRSPKNEYLRYTPVTPVEEISHHGAENLTWQYDVYNFMRNYCHVRFKKASDWRPYK